MAVDVAFDNFLVVQRCSIMLRGQIIFIALSPGIQA